jgi:hypothetical protein
MIVHGDDHWHSLAKLSDGLGVAVNLLASIDDDVIEGCVGESTDGL